MVGAEYGLSRPLVGLESAALILGVPPLRDVSSAFHFGR
jgi:hypothetical protein